MKTRKKLIFLNLLLISLFFTFSCTQETKKTESNNNVKHFRHILFSETPFDEIKGTYPLNSEEAEKINNYKFTYDENNRLKSIEYVRGNKLLGSSSLGAAKIAMEYNNNKETRYFFDKEGNTTENRGVFKYEFTYNDNGIKTGLRFLDKDNNLIENSNKIAYFKWEILKDGLVKENRYNLADEETVLNEFCPFYELRFSYDEKGYIKRMANFQADTLYNCTVENCGDVGVSYFLFKMSKNGDLEEFSVHNTVGQYSNLYWGWARLVNKYDEFGNATETAYYDQDNEPLGGKTVPVRQYKYDDHGAVTEVSFMNKDRNLMNHPSAGYAVTQYKYKDNGQPSDTLRFDKNMEVFTKES